MSEIRVPGDKSIAHRLLLLGALAEGESIVSGVPGSLDVGSTLGCLRALGAAVEEIGEGRIRIVGPTAWTSPPASLDCGNSGTTARLLTGLLSGLGIEAELSGDESLLRRPMDRVVYPLQAMGARIRYLDREGRLPLKVEARTSGGLRALRYTPRTSSAQVRAALLLAALAARTRLEIVDRLRPRDHTERILRSLGVPVVSDPAPPGERVTFSPADWDGALRPIRATVPGDASSSAFLVVAAILQRRDLTIRGVALNPTRMGFLRVLSEMGAVAAVVERGVQAGEPVGDVSVGAARVRPYDIGPTIVPQLIDELPALAVLASRIEGASVVRGAGELRVKESDRLALLAANFASLGVRCEESEDGLTVFGSRAPLTGSVRTGGDHRIAMAFGALGSAPDCEIHIDDPECVNVSFPGFWEALGQVASAEVAR